MVCRCGGVCDGHVYTPNGYQFGFQDRLHILHTRDGKHKRNGVTLEGSKLFLRTATEESVGGAAHPTIENFRVLWLALLVHLVKAIGINGLYACFIYFYFSFPFRSLAYSWGVVFECLVFTVCVPFLVIKVTPFLFKVDNLLCHNKIQMLYLRHLFDCGVLIKTVGWKHFRFKNEWSTLNT